MSVSVVIPAYNAALCIERAVHSALDQSLQPAEVIVIDDGSTDATSDVVSRLSRADARIMLLRQPINSGPAAARNAGIKSALCDWIAILDADDAFLKDRLRYLVEAAERQNLAFAADNITLYDAVAQQASGLGIELDRIGPCLAIDRYTLVRNCMMNGQINFSVLKPIMRRSFLLQSGLLYPEDSRVGEDFIFYLRAIIAGAKFALFPESGYLYTQPVGSLSGVPSGLSRTVVDHYLLERRTLELASEPAVCADPVLQSLLIARAAKINSLHRRRELRDLFRRRDIVGLALQFMRHADARAFVTAGIRRRVARFTSSSQGG